MSLAGESLAVIEGIRTAVGLSRAVNDALRKGAGNFRAILPDGSLLRDQEDAMTIAEMFGP